MFIIDYPISSLCLMAAIALSIAMLVRFLDSYLKILRVTPSPLSAWKFICKKLVIKLTNKNRSDKAMRLRARMLIIMLISCAIFISYFIIITLNKFNNDYVETILLAFTLLSLPNQAPSIKNDASSKVRERIENDGITVLQGIIAPITGWILFGWYGVITFITITSMMNHTRDTPQAFNSDIKRLGNLILIPASIFGVLLIFLSALVTSKGKPLLSLRAGLERILEPHIAITVAIAGAMSLSLAGASGHYKHILGKSWLGNGVARCQQADIKRWQWLSTIAQLFLIFILITLSLLM